MSNRSIIFCGVIFALSCATSMRAPGQDFDFSQFSDYRSQKFGTKPVNKAKISGRVDDLRELILETRESSIENHMEFVKRIAKVVGGLNEDEKEYLKETYEDKYKIRRWQGETVDMVIGELAQKLNYGQTANRMPLYNELVYITKDMVLDIFARRKPMSELLVKYHELATTADNIETTYGMSNGPLVSDLFGREFERAANMRQQFGFFNTTTALAKHRERKWQFAILCAMSTDSQIEDAIEVIRFNSSRKRRSQLPKTASEWKLLPLKGCEDYLVESEKLKSTIFPDAKVVSVLAQLKSSRVTSSQKKKAVLALLKSGFGRTSINRSLKVALQTDSSESTLLDGAVKYLEQQDAIEVLSKMGGFTATFDSKLARAIQSFNRGNPESLISLFKNEGKSSDFRCYCLRRACLIGSKQRTFVDFLDRSPSGISNTQKLELFLHSRGIDLENHLPEDLDEMSFQERKKVADQVMVLSSELMLANTPINAWGKNFRELLINELRSR